MLGGDAMSVAPNRDFSYGVTLTFVNLILIPRV